MQYDFYLLLKFIKISQWVSFNVNPTDLIL